MKFHWIPKRNTYETRKFGVVLGLGQKKMEDKFGASTDTQFRVQIFTEVRVKNLDKFGHQLNSKAIVKVDYQKERVKREKFPEFVKRNPTFFMEQEE